MQNPGSVIEIWHQVGHGIGNDYKIESQVSRNLEGSFFN